MFPIEGTATVYKQRFGGSDFSFTRVPFFILRLSKRLLTVGGLAVLLPSLTSLLPFLRMRLPPSLKWKQRLTTFKVSQGHPHKLITHLSAILSHTKPKWSLRALSHRTCSIRKMRRFLQTENVSLLTMILLLQLVAPAGQHSCVDDLLPPTPQPPPVLVSLCQNLTVASISLCIMCTTFLYFSVFVHSLW